MRRVVKCAFADRPGVSFESFVIWTCSYSVQFEFYMVIYDREHEHDA